MLWNQRKQTTKKTTHWKSDWNGISLHVKSKIKDESLLTDLKIKFISNWKRWRYLSPHSQASQRWRPSGSIQSTNTSRWCSQRFEMRQPRLTCPSSISRPKRMAAASSGREKVCRWSVSHATSSSVITPVDRVSRTSSPTVIPLVTILLHSAVSTGQPWATVSRASF